MHMERLQLCTVRNKVQPCTSQLLTLNTESQLHAAAQSQGAKSYDAGLQTTPNDMHLERKEKKRQDYAIRQFYKEQLEV